MDHVSPPVPDLAHKFQRAGLNLSQSLTAGTDPGDPQHLTEALLTTAVTLHRAIREIAASDRIANVEERRALLQAAYAQDKAVALLYQATKAMSRHAREAADREAA
ncbi:hypothetical protein BDK92_7134 [Micromonospora pisi]|uniref:Uncharacterized protein n=1 Tax=Micromonospora pisi TaxID=589240 RepID=A0A495JVQ2_9ACTN|nr:hypothetical protein [Micromonospora pisi]RKR92658.1 hypothetical protein BDK92_7134 [Micromonospora pisi]